MLLAQQALRSALGASQRNKLTRLRQEHALPHEILEDIRRGADKREIREVAAHIALLHREGAAAPTHPARRGAKQDLRGAVVMMARAEHWPQEPAGPEYYTGVILRRARGKFGTAGNWEVFFPLDKDDQVYTFHERYLTFTEAAGSIGPATPPQGPTDHSGSAAAAQTASSGELVAAEAQAAHPAEPAGAATQTASSEEPQAQRLADVEELEEGEIRPDSVAIVFYGLGVRLGDSREVAASAVRRFAARELGVSSLGEIYVRRIAKAKALHPSRSPDILVAELSKEDKAAIWRAKRNLPPTCSVSIDFHRDRASHAAHLHARRLRMREPQPAAVTPGLSLPFWVPVPVAACCNWAMRGDGAWMLTTPPYSCLTPNFPLPRSTETPERLCTTRHSMGPRQRRVAAQRLVPCCRPQPPAPDDGTGEPRQQRRAAVQSRAAAAQPHPGQQRSATPALQRRQAAAQRVAPHHEQHSGPADDVAGPCGNARQSQQHGGGAQPGQPQPADGAGPSRPAMTMQAQ
jgi:hypothetical protein